MPTWTDTIGYFAAFLLVLTFFMRNMIQLRITAICSSLAWLVYGLIDTLYPVIVLHCVLLPINSYRLWQDLHRPRSADAQ
jgi:CRP/FNR family transcriptional regulator, cyclic AMP receptor protein